MNYFKRLVLTGSLLISMTASNAIAGDKLSLMLDWFPNIDHLPIYVAEQNGYFKERGLEVEIITPSETADALKLAAIGKVDLAVSYQPQTIIAAANGLKIQTVARLVAHPLTTLLYLDDKIKKPSDLSGKKIGYTVPGLMDVMLKAFAEINGIENYSPINVGFTILPALTTNNVAAVMGPFKTYETVGMAAHGYKAKYFELEKYGIPDYEELIFIAGKDTIEAKTAQIASFRAAIDEAMAFTKEKPEEALKAYFAALPGADKKIETEAYKLTKPFFAYDGESDPVKWQEFGDFALEYGLINIEIDAAMLIYQPQN
ncbi:MAG: ABC transporter substrate-binding protein [Desulfotalea sp.]